jgi:DNA-binding MarR family transcriptional regulator
VRFLRTGPGDDVVTEATAELRLHGAVNDLADQAVADYLGLNRTDARCLDIIERLDGVTAGRLAAEASLSSGAVTTVIDRLERAGFAQRVPDPSDRRRVLVEVTPSARAELAALSAPLAEAARRLFEGYTEEEARFLRDFMREVRRVKEGYAAQVRGLAPVARQGAGEAGS